MTRITEGCEWQRARQGDARALDRLAEEHLPLVRHVARRFASPGSDIYDDLLGSGSVGLSAALLRYDPERGTKFSTFAFPLILGEMRQYLRRQGAVHMGRQMRRAVSRVRQLEEECGATGETASLKRAARELGVDLSDLTLALEASRAPAQMEIAAAREAQDSWSDPQLHLDKLALRQGLMRLPDHLKAVLLLRYFQGLSQEKTATELGISQSQVSRRERLAREVLRDQLL